jgi:hypothetical protein
MRYWWVCLNDKLWLTEKIPDRLRSRNAVARRPDTFDATSELAQRAGVAFALFVILTPFPATVDFERWEKAQQTRARENQWYPTRPRSVSLLRACLASYSFPSCTGRCMPVLASRPTARGRVEQVSGHAYLGSLPGACFRGNLYRIWKTLHAANR